MNYTQTFGSTNTLIGVSGIIGVGKSTLTKSLGEIGNYNVLHEPVETNEYLSKFYEDMSRYSFPMQIYLLNHRFKQHQQMVWSDESTVQDRTIYEDVIFAKMLRESGHMEDLDFKTYVGLFQNMCNFLHRPDVIVYLDVDPKVALARINQRSRGCESGIPLEYLESLRDGYEEWLQDIEGRIPVLRLDWNTYQDPKVIHKKIQKLIKAKKGLIV
jgi:deoxyadenosine kinase